MALNALHTTAGSFVCKLADADDVANCGGKAVNLGHSLREGITVPTGFVVTSHAFNEFLSYNDLAQRIDRIIKHINYNEHSSLFHSASEIRQLVESAEIPDAVLDVVRDARDKLFPNATTLVVRSSAVGEDSQSASFAGQLDSILHVDCDTKLKDALLTCWASYWSERSLFYQHSRNVQLHGMGVIIQQQVDSEISGVLFTRSPESANAADNVMMAEFCRGLGSELVSGHVTPARVSIGRSDSLWTILEKPSDSEEFINDAIVSKLVDAGLTLERLFDGPQDIEWTVDESGEFYLLQSRPISVARSKASSLQNSNDTRAAKRRTIVWSNANVNENYPDPISPFLYSVASDGYYHYFRNLGAAFGISKLRIEAMENPLRNIIGVHAARMYYNLSNIHACLRMAPFGESLTQSFNTFVGTSETPESQELPDWNRFRRSRLAQSAEVCRIFGKAVWKLCFLSRRVRRFEDVVDRFANGSDPDRLDKKSAIQLIEDLRGFLHIRRHEWTNASLADASAMLSYGLLKRFLHHQFPEKESATIHNTLLKGLPNLASNLPVMKLWELSRHIRADSQLRELFSNSDALAILDQIQTRREFAAFHKEFEAYLDECGFRCSGELMLTVPSFQEYPEKLIELLKSYVEIEGESPIDRLNRESAERDSETRQMLKALWRKRRLKILPISLKAAVAKRLLKWTQNSIAFRERARSKQALLYNRCRRIALTIGRRLMLDGYLESDSDVFFLTPSELDDLVSGTGVFPAQVTELVDSRKVEHARLSTLKPPASFELSDGVHWTESSDSGVEICSSDVSNQNVSKLGGLGACGGTVTGRAAVLNNVSEFDRLQQGDILVTRQTDPGWGPLFFLINGLVIERGGMLSHGAILAREYGIPTVVGVENASSRIVHGQLLNVDGDCGVVELVD